MKCEYCGNKWEKAKYSEGCKSCYGPKPKAKLKTKPYSYEVNRNIDTLEIRHSPVSINMVPGGGGGYGGGGGAGYYAVGGSGGAGIMIGGHR